MKRWSREERALKSYFNAQVKQEESNSPKENLFGKDIAAQLAFMVAGLAVLVILGCGQNYESHPFEQGLAVVGELLRSIRAL